MKMTKTMTRALLCAAMMCAAAQGKSGADTLTASIMAKAKITRRPLRVILKAGIESVVAASE